MIKRLGNSHYTRPPDGKKKNNGDEPWTVQCGRYLSAATQYLTIIGAGGIIGWLLDGQFGTTPYILITGVFCSAGAGLYYLIYTLDTIHKKSDD